MKKIYEINTINWLSYSLKIFFICLIIFPISLTSTYVFYFVRAIIFLLYNNIMNINISYLYYTEILIYIFMLFNLIYKLYNKIMKFDINNTLNDVKKIIKNILIIIYCVNQYIYFLFFIERKFYDSMHPFQCVYSVYYSPISLISYYFIGIFLIYTVEKKVKIYEKNHF